MLICAYEDRAANEPAVRLLVHSLFLHDPGARLRLYFDPPTADFARWAAGYPGLDLRPADFGEGIAWNVKPAVLLAALDDGEDAALWIDADIIVTRALTARFDRLDPASLVVAEEALWGRRDNRASRRTRLWDMAVGRDIPRTLNSAVLRVTAQHRDLLLRWRDLLDSPAYRVAQAGAWDARPLHMMGDQDVLTALLGSTDFAHVPIAMLRRGRDILQLFGPLAFTIAERLRVATRGLPPFVHAQGSLPWQPSDADRAYRETSPYLLCAKAMPEAGGERGWIAPRTRSGAMLRAIGLGSIALTGAPVALVQDMVRPVRAAVRMLRRISGVRERP